MKYSREIEKVFAERLKKSDRLFSFWTHLPDIDRDAEKIAEATVAFQKTFDLDFIKNMPNGMYAIEDYGTEIDFSDIPNGGVARVVSTPFQTVEDWAKLAPADLDSGAFERELRAISLIRQALPDVPILFTVFSPISIANKLSQGRVLEQLANPQNRPTIHRALAVLADDVARLSRRALEAGATGVFFAHQDTDRQRYDYDIFCEFIRAYDLEALSGARDGGFNVLHLHGESIRFFELSDYPLDALNWHLWETLPNADTVRNTIDKCIVGGINRWSITENDREALQAQIATMLAIGEEMGDVIITPGCTIRHGFKPETLHFIRDQIRTLQVAPPDRTTAAQVAGKTVPAKTRFSAAHVSMNSSVA